MQEFPAKIGVPHRVMQLSHIDTNSTESYIVVPYYAIGNTYWTMKSWLLDIDVPLFMPPGLGAQQFWVAVGSSCAPQFDESVLDLQKGTSL